MAIPKSFFKPLPAYEWTEEVAEKLAGKIHSAQLTKKERAQEKQRQKKILYQAAKKIITNFPTELGHPRPHLNCTLKPLYERIAVLNHEVERQLFGKYYIYQNLGSWFVECFLPSDLAERFDHTDEIYELNLQGNEGKSRKHREDAALLAHLLRWWTSRGNPIETWNQKDNHLVEFLASTTGRAYETITDILKTVKPNPKPKIPEEYENLDVFSSQIYSANPACQPTKEQVRNYKLVKNDNDVKKLESLLSNIPNNYKGNFTNFFP